LLWHYGFTIEESNNIFSEYGLIVPEDSVVVEMECEFVHQDMYKIQSNTASVYGIVKEKNKENNE